MEVPSKSIFMSWHNQDTLVIVYEVASSFLAVAGNAKTFKAWFLTKRAGHSVKQMKRLKVQKLNGDRGKRVI